MKKSMFCAICLLFSGLLLSQSDFRTVKSNIKISGTSTLHDWTADVSKVNGSGSFAVSNGTLKSLDALSVSIDATAIKSEKGSMMDKNMYKALKTKQYPTITFTLSKVNSLEKKAAGYEIKAEGKLTIAGTTKTVELVATGKVGAGSEVTFTGTKKLKMTDFNVEPPVLMLGTLKTGDEVTIAFETTLSNSGLSQK